MLFNSYIFMFIFLPVVISGYFLLNQMHRYRVSLLFLLGMSFWFYGYFNYNYLVIIIASILFNYGSTFLMRKHRKNEILRNVLFALALIFNIGLIFYFKYYDFFVSTINDVFDTNISIKNIVLPLGISFFTIQQISYVIDIYKGKTDNVRLLEYAVYVSFFPQLIAGPIVRYDELIPQIRNIELKRFKWDNFARGVYCFILGLSKKVLIADMFGIVADFGFDNYRTLNSASLLLAVFSYTIQIYFDFSGYSDMAIGLGKMLNFTLPVNFNSPYKAVTIVDFWNRWHLTLTRFWREYIYFPLGGNRKGKVRTYINILIVFCISGIWHGANWNFFLWGGVHGIAMIIARMCRKGVDKIPKIILWGMNFFFLMATWTLFRADSISQAVEILKKILLFNSGEINDYMLQNTIPLEIRTALYIRGCIFPTASDISKNIAYIVWFIILLLVVKGKNIQELERDFVPNRRNCLIIAVLTWLCIISFSGVSTFLYFNF